MHARRVPPDEEGFAGPVLLLHERQRPRGNLLVDRLHALLGERAGILDLAAGERMDHASRAESLLEFWILGIVDALRLLFGVEVIEIAEELVEAVGGREELVTVAQVVLAELAGGVAQGFQQLGNRRVFRAQSEVGPGQAHLGQTSADRRLPGEERGAAGGATLLTVPVGEHRAFPGDAVDVGRLVTHYVHVVGADVVPPDIIPPDDEDVRLLAGLLRLCGLGQYQHHGSQNCANGGPGPSAPASCYVLRHALPPVLPTMPRLLVERSHTSVRSTLTSLALERENLLPVVLHADDDPATLLCLVVERLGEDRKSTRLNSSHLG